MHIFRMLLVWSLAASAKAAASNIWYSNEAEYNFVESITLIVLVILAIGFEIGCHFLAHSSKHSYYFGRIQSRAGNEDPCAKGRSEESHHKGMKHKRLHKELVNRMAAEFMSLGFLAFLIFVANQAGLFDVLEDRVPHCDSGGAATHSSSNSSRTLAGGLSSQQKIPADGPCWHMPASSADWLFMAEIVHVKLFVGMMLYFVLMYGVVRGSTHKLEEWEKLRLRRLGSVAVQMNTYARKMIEEGVSKVDVELQEYKAMRSHFVWQAYQWRHTRPRLYNSVLEKLGIPVDEDDAGSRFLEAMEGQFVFSAYLAINVEHGVIESIEVHAYTWACIGLLFVFFSLCHRLFEITMLSLVPAFMGIAFVILAVMVIVTKWRTRAILNMEENCQSSRTWDAEPTRQKSGWRANLEGRGKYSTEKWVLRFLQVFLFLISNNFAGTIADAHHWKMYFMETLLTAAGFSLLFAILLFYLPRYVPLFLQLMALPPFVDDDNAAVLFGVLLSEAHSEHNERVHALVADAAGRSFTNSEENVPAMDAVFQLAGLLEDCEDLSDLKQIRTNLKLRLQSSKKAGIDNGQAEEEVLAERGQVPPPNSATKVMSPEFPFTL